MAANAPWAADTIVLAPITFLGAGPPAAGHPLHNGEFDNTQWQPPWAPGDELK